MKIFTVLQVALIIFKALGWIDWSWWAVFIPMYISITLFAVMVWAIKK